MLTQFSNLSLRLKLFGGFALMIVLVALTAVTGEALDGQTYSATKTLATRSVPVVELAEAVQYDIANTFGLQATYILGQHTAQRGYFVQALDQTRGDITRLGRYATDATYRRDFDRVQSGLSQFVGLDNTAWADVQNGGAPQMAAAAKITLDTAVPAYNALLGGATAFLDHAKAQAQDNLASARSAHRTFTWASIVIGLLGILLGGAIAFFVSRSIKRRVDLVLDRLRRLESGPVAGVRDGLGAFASGDLTRTFSADVDPIAAPGGDEVGQVAVAVNGIRTALLGALDRYEDSRIRLGGLVGQVSRSAADLSAASTQMAATSDDAGRASGEIAQAIGDIADGAQRQVEAVFEAQRSAQEVASAVEEAVVSAAATAEAAQRAREAAQGGFSSAEQADEAMRSVRESSLAAGTAIRGLAEKSTQIGAIVATIAGIADQTNLLALNAAIEAARAGEQGRGFAVVAEEVRKLAEDSQRATHEISELVSAIQRETNHAVDVVEDGARRTEDGTAIVAQTRETFEQIDSSVQGVGERIEQIAAISERIAAGARTMEQGISEVVLVAERSSATTQEVSASTETNSASAQEIAASAQQLSASAETLSELVSQFSLT